jgi:hypothetical protein
LVAFHSGRDARAPSSYLLLAPMRLPPNRLLKGEKNVLRQAQHERTIFSTGNPNPFALSLSKGERKIGCCSLSGYSDSPLTRRECCDGAQVRKRFVIRADR